jgi:hypothetical protein
MHGANLQLRLVLTKNKVDFVVSMDQLECFSCGKLISSGDACHACESHHFIGQGAGVSKVQLKPIHETALHYCTQYHQLFSGMMLTAPTMLKFVRFFTVLGKRGLLIIPNIFGLDADARKRMGTISDQRKLEYFTSHVAFLRNEISPSNPKIYTNMGQTVKVQFEENKPKALKYGEMVVPIMKWLIAANGNVIYVVPAVLFFGELIEHNVPLLTFNSLLHLTQYVECSRMIKLLRDTGLHDELTADASIPFTVMVSRNDFLTQKRMQYFIEKGKEYTKNVLLKHIVRGYFTPSTYEQGMELVLMTRLDYAITEAKSKMKISTAIFGDQFEGWTILTTQEAKPVAARVCSTLIMRVGVILIMDRMFYNFPKKLEPQLPSFL